MRAPSWFDWKKADLEAKLRGPGLDPGVDLLERLVAVDLGLTGADEVQVRPLQDQDTGHRIPSGVAVPSMASAAVRTTSSGISSRTSTPVAVGRTQRRRPPWCFLSVARRSRTASASVGQRRPTEIDRIEGSTDPLGAFRRRHADRDADVTGGAQAVGDGFAMQELAVAGGRLERMPQGVPQVEGDPTTRRPLFALVGDDDLDLGPGTALDDLGDEPIVEGTRRALGDRLAVALEQLEQTLVAERGHLDGLAEGGPAMALGQRPERRDVDDDVGRLMERADEVLALGQVHGGLAADRRVDLGDQGRRDVDERHAAQVRGGEEPGGVAEGAAADGDERLIATDPQPGELARGGFDDGHPLGILALREHDGLDRGQPAGQQARGQIAPDGVPGTRLGDEDRPPCGQSRERVTRRVDRDPFPERQPADRRRRPQERGRVIRGRVGPGTARLPPGPRRRRRRR